MAIYFIPFCHFVWLSLLHLVRIFAILGYLELIFYATLLFIFQLYRRLILIGRSHPRRDQRHFPLIDLKQPATYPLETSVLDDNKLSVVHASLYDDVDERQISTYQRTPIVDGIPFRKVYVESLRSTEGLAAKLRLPGKSPIRLESGITVISFCPKALNNAVAS